MPGDPAFRKDSGGVDMFEHGLGKAEGGWRGTNVEPEPIDRKQVGGPTRGSQSFLDSRGSACL
jgi:hypothetical protein